MSHPPSLTDPYIPVARTKPMRVLCLGMCRTGTESLRSALKILGYTPYKGPQLMKNWETSIPLWTEALDAKYKGVGRLWGRKEFDVMLGDYDTVLDVPTILLAEDVIKAYPEAKVILTNRDETTWLRSMNEIAGDTLNWWTYPYIWQFHKKTQYRVGFLWKCMDIMAEKDFSDDGPALEAFRSHYDLVRRLVPSEQLLEFKSEHGWKSLCQFLDKEVPDQPYPRTNDRVQLKRLQVLAYYVALIIALLKIGSVVVILLLAAGYLSGPST